jgi:hypothetical protein
MWLVAPVSGYHYGSKLCVKTVERVKITSVMFMATKELVCDQGWKKKSVQILGSQTMSTASYVRFG